MIQLSRPRSFGEYISDAIEFLKQQYKHFFGSFFRIVAIPMVVLIGIGYFALNSIFSGIVTTTSTSFVDESLSFNAISGDFTTSMLILFAFILILILVQALVYAYTPIYLMLYKEYGTSFDHKDIIATYKVRLSKIVKFTLGMIPLTIVLLIPVAIAMAIMVVTIVGILAIPLLLGYLAVSINNAYSEYLNTDASFMDSISFGFKLTHTKFWPNVGSATLFYFLVNIIVNMIVVIPYYIYLFANMATGLSDPEKVASFAYGKATVLYYLASIVSSMIMMIIVQTQLGIVYYSNVEENTNDEQHSEIDTIGRNV